MVRPPLRPAVAMIELIFAIVIMGIVMMSAPTLISTAQQSTTVALQQEGINEAASRLNMILTYAWDEQDTRDTCVPPVLGVTNGDSALNENGTTARRIGSPMQSAYRTFLCDGARYNASTTLGFDTDDSNASQPDDIDDFNGATAHLIVESGGSGGADYLEKGTVNIATTVSYASDAANYSQSSFSFTPNAGMTTTNIKQIDVTLTSISAASELQKTIKLHAFSCNIGGAEFEKKVIP